MITSSSNGVTSSRLEYCAGASQNSRYDRLDVEPPFEAPVPPFAAGSAPPALGAPLDPDRRWRVAWTLARKSPKWSLISCGADGWAVGGCTTVDQTRSVPMAAEVSRVLILGVVQEEGAWTRPKRRRAW